MKNSSYTPIPELQEFIASYVIQEVPEGETEPFFSPPLAMSGFIFTVANSSGFITAKIDNRDFFTENAVATGQVTAPVYGQMVGEVKSILVFFKPTGMHRLFRNDLSELTNTSKTLSEFLGQEEADRLWRNLTDHSDNQKQIEVLNSFFKERLPTEEKEDRFEEVLDYIHATKGGITLADIAQNSSYSRKTLERHFKKMVGLSPKVYIQIYRFKCLINFLQSNPGITWVQLASQTGYYDQSHMSRYFKEYLKVSPNSIVTLDLDLIHYLLSR
ncbi:AraC family transcriptional regulator [Algoriphagus persicinus]|uniref:AraC family transcriptional regulator n=1 Tax=Algoriphagus persicinus TaxID=3108754 RepID=UPI002B3E47BF|nr:AraC family transcriptional regulator [Algoriphagus sp. E1-3-M2]MEB2787174.1 AraC family transcriptional regulator [Algoriphagus sp. E1-3-M2]